MSNTQNTETPIEFINAVEEYLGIEFTYDMACTFENRKAPIAYTEKDDSLSIDWPLDGWIWLNPPFKEVGKWVKKCKEQSDRGCRIVSIWPLSGDLNMIPAWEDSKVHIIHGRVWPLVRGCMLCVWNNGGYGIDGLRWDKKTLKAVW